MTREEARADWTAANAELQSAVALCGYPAALSDTLSRELKSPKAIRRMAAYLRLARPRSLEQIADELLAINRDVEVWKQRRESREANERYNAWLNRGAED